MEYQVTWTEITTYSATVEATSLEDARSALMGGDYDDKDCVEYAFNEIESIVPII